MSKNKSYYFIIIIKKKINHVLKVEKYLSVSIKKIIKNF